jgi:hypothetical protein
MEQIATKPTSEREKLTNWQAEPELKQLKSEFLACESTHSTLVANIDKWNRLHAAELPAEMAKDKTRSQAQPKLVRRQAEWRYAALSEPMLSSPRLFTIKPTTGEDQDAAKQNERLINHQFYRNMNRVGFIDSYVRSAVDEGTVVVRLGWDREEKKIKRTVPVWDYFDPSTQQEQELLQTALETRESDPTTFELRAPSSLKASLAYYDETGELLIAIDSKTTTEIEETQVIKNTPTAEVIDARNLRIDPTCGGDITKAMFMIYSFETTRSQLLKDRKRLSYKNLDQIDWGAVGPLQTEYHHAQSNDTSFNFDDRSRKKIVVHEYWGLYDIHKNGTLVPIVASWIGDTLVRMVENPYPDGKPPFVVVPYLPKKRSVHGEADAALLEDQQQNIGALLRGMIDILGRSAAGQTGIASGTMDALNRRRFLNGQNYEFNPNMPVEKAIHTHTYPEISVSAVNLMQILNNDAEAISGVKSFSQGISGSSYGKVAAGARAAMDASAKREMGILRRLVTGLIEIARKMIAMNQVFLSEKEVIRVTNEPDLQLERPEGQSDVEFVTINRVELAGQFDIEIDIATAEVDEAQSQDLGFMLQTLGPSTDFSVVKIILCEIARLKRLPHLEKAVREYQPQPDPLVQKKTELEIAMLEAEIAETKAKTAEALARAKKATAEAEQTDLDTVEQGTGVEHQRNLATAQAQAEGNQNLEVTKALTKPKKENEQEGDIEAAVGWNELNRDIGKPSPTVDTVAPPQAQVMPPEQVFAEPPGPLDQYG